MSVGLSTEGIMEETLNLEEIIDIIRKNLVMIIGFALLCAVFAMFITTFFMTNQYRATTQILVGQAQGVETFTNQDIQTNLQLINTYRDIIKSPFILDEVVDNLGLTYGSNELANRLTISSGNQSQVFNLSVESTIPENAAIIANEVANVFRENLTEVINVDNVSILSEATVGENPSPVSPRPLVNTMIGLILGGLFALGLAFARSFLDKTLRTEEDVQKYLDLPVVGTVANYGKKRG